ncbi:hypothetical protein ABZ208_14990 [Streptomyces sp. NPDC006208]|uniref:hypothetical protein n=1 Tax=Streptomyces sp. NPDC006208 TaxID=3156734 RepID=UPI0033BDBF3E
MAYRGPRLGNWRRPPAVEDPLTYLDQGEVADRHGDKRDEEAKQIGRQDVAQPEFHHVARHQGRDLHRGNASAAYHHGLMADLSVEGFGGFLCAVLVHEAEPDRQCQDHTDDHRIAVAADDIRDGRGSEQEPQQR